MLQPYLVVVRDHDECAASDRSQVLVVERGIAAAGSDLVGRTLNAVDLARLPMVGYLPSRTFDLVESYMAVAGVTPRFVYRSNDNATVQAMVAAGLGVAVMPRLAVGGGDPRLALVELAQPAPLRVITAVWHRYRRLPPFARAFVDMAESVAADIASVH